MNPIRILIVDDSVVYRKLLSDAVTSLPNVAAVVTASSGRSALARLAAETFDLVLLDVFMPEMSGQETLVCIRRDHPNVAVVMVSGATGRDAEVTLNSLASGALDFIPKPLADSFQNGMDIMRGQLQRVIQLVGLRAPSRPAAAQPPAQPAAASLPLRAPAAPPPLP
ncbi:MAG: response regulator, partial [Verrucomicrobiae bacterium]